MEETRCGKKILLATILTAGLALAISQSALAQPDGAVAAKKSQWTSMQMMDPAARQAAETFLNDTVAERKALMEKSATLRALMSSSAPDTDKIGQLAGEVFDLREKLRAKALADGVPAHMMMRGMMMGDGFPCMGDGMGMGMGGRWHRR